MRSKRFLKGLAAFLMSVLVTFPTASVPFMGQNIIYAQDTNLKIEDGVMLHAFDWSFKTIEDKLPEIAQAGYTAIQVSPVQGTKEGSTDASFWWLLYQPTNQAIGNSQLGTRDQFKSLCEAADEYGIKIVVDAVMNHMANNGDSNSWTGVVDSAFDRSDFYHNKGQCSEWDNRYAVTQEGIGMPDLNTQNKDVQGFAINFLNDCISCGADGFRFDAAKHIETNRGTDSGQSWAGDYWDNVLGNLNEDVFVYGEVLQGGADNLNAYASFMKVTDHSYGWTLRQAVANKNVTGIGSYNTGLEADQLVSYFENHDNYEDGSSSWMTDTQRKLAWGILAARADVTPLLLSRPTSSIGNSGEELWKNQEVVAVNYFHNAMAGENEYIRYPKQEAVQIDRGTKGSVIVNTSDSFYLNSSTNLKDGTYVDKSGSGASFTVSGGQITGNVPSESVVVLGDYEAEGGGTSGDEEEVVTGSVTTDPVTPVAGETVTITYDASNTVLKGASQVLLHWGYDSWTTNADVNMELVEANKWQVTVTVPEVATSTLDFVFTNGSGTWDNNSSSDWHITITKSDDAGDDEEVSTAKVAYFDNSAYNWDQVNIYIYDESGSSVKEVASWPGVAMTDEGNGLYSYDFTEDWEDAKVIFNNGNTQIPGSGQTGFSLTGNMIYSNGTWSAK